MPHVQTSNAVARVTLGGVVSVSIAISSSSHVRLLCAYLYPLNKFDRNQIAMCLKVKYETPVHEMHHSSLAPCEHRMNASDRSEVR